MMRPKKQPKKLSFNGREYTYEELAEKSGVNKSTIRERIRKNPDITLEELFCPSKRTFSTSVIYAEINGVEKSLREWSKETGIQYDTIYARHKRGIRGKQLICPPNYRPRTVHGIRPILSEENIQWILDTRPRRKGQPNEWEIACELIGADASYAEWLKNEFEKRGLI